MDYIQLDRHFFENSYWKQKRRFSLSEAWIDLLQLAQFEADTREKILPNGRQISIERGEIHVSLRLLAKRWGWGVMQVRTFLKKGMLSHQLTQRITQGETMLSICNYDKYSPSSNTDYHTEQRLRVFVSPQE